VRDQAAGVELGQDAVEAKLLLQAFQAVYDAIGRADAGVRPDIPRTSRKRRV
jgi:hypothetical protein